MPRIYQHDVRQVGSSSCGENWAMAALFHQVGQVAAVVNVCVRKDDCIDFAWVKGKVAVTFIRFLPPPLVKATVQQQVVSIYRQQMLRTGNSLGCPVKIDPHHASSLEPRMYYSPGSTFIGVMSFYW